MDRVQRALNNYKNGYTCCQAVACAFADDKGTEQIVFNAARGFGLGMGDGECTCGAVVGAVMACGIINGTEYIGNMDSTIKSLKSASHITQEFRKRNGSVICKELKGMETDKVLCTCQDCIASATKLAEEL